jgi:dinuclear metal center YbgI/SA1388 family protein
MKYPIITVYYYSNCNTLPRETKVGFENSALHFVLLTASWFMVQLHSVIKHLEALLPAQDFSDRALNGLQVEAEREDINKIALAVDSGLSIIESAVAEDAGLLIVHHGLFWGEVLPITGVFGRKIELLLRKGCSLYASHLPLDSNIEVGNGFELGRYLDLEDLKGFCEYNGVTVGARGRCQQPVIIDYFVEKAAALEGCGQPVVLPFGPKKIKTVGIVTGSAWHVIKECHKEDIDLFVSGESSHSAYHLAKDLKINAIFMGHYATETFGVKALQTRLEKYFDISTVFLHEPTGI